jgi:FKBP-type peptidyl-prolyl cis-trans isomerase FkpA
MRFSRIAAGVLVVAAGVALVIACTKSYKPCSPTSAAEDDATMKAYISANGITASQHSSGMYYQIIEEGTGVNPTINSIVSAKYTGRLSDGSVFDSGDSVAFPLSQVIPGWQIGIPLVKSGGTIKLIIPPSMAYGCEDQKRGGVTIIPGNSVLVFDVKVLKVQ